MSFPTYSEFILESEKSEGFFLTVQDFEKLESEIPLLEKMMKSFVGTMKVLSYPVAKEENTNKDEIKYGKKRDGFFFFPRESDGRNFGIVVEDAYGRGSASEHKNGLSHTFKKFENSGHCWLVPDYFQEKLYLVFEYDPNLKPGQSEMKRIYNWDEAQRMGFRYNANSLSQIKEIVERSLKQALEKTKDVRVVIKPKVIKENKPLAKKVSLELKKVYEFLVDEFLQQGNLSPDLVEDDLFGLALLKAAKDNPEDLKFLNNLPKQAFDTWLSYVTDSDPEKSFRIDSQFIDSIEKIYKMKPLWNLI